MGQVKSKILVSADNILSITAFGRKELSTANVKGCRIDDKSITIEPTSAAYQKIIIGGYKNLGNSEDLVAWLTTNFSDLDDLDLKEEQDELTHDQRIGSTELEREEKLAKTKRIALAYNITGGLVGIAGLVFKNEYMLIGLLTYPLIGILLLKLNNGIIKFVSNRKKSFYPHIVAGFLIPAAIVFLSAISEYEILNNENVVLPAAATALITAYLLYTFGPNKTTEPVKMQLIMMFVVSGIYGFGGTLNVNCAFDRSSPQLLNATVKDIDITQHKGTHYYLYLKSWNADPASIKIEVSSAVYYHHKIGSIITVDLKSGVFNIPWFYVPD